MCVLSIVVMIVTSVTDHVGGAIAAGMTAAIAILCLMLVTAVAGPEALVLHDLVSLSESPCSPGQLDRLAQAEGPR